ncbi:hypothetical protein Plim_2450 [Planctopirus limnophila DSM 3776]|uniref:Uncharacterized protein n=1 Tax=Planctopirus limnophila (strain ATCC 43296 / DSM 3776 / IFAM 1008 / Mu 290) TaxID=521674 RepID=D5SPD2_PLAL2|nr:hypothetical protein Plim_2450 [Planctopirus limnophila DSM 3776]
MERGYDSLESKDWEFGYRMLAIRADPQIQNIVKNDQLAWHHVQY